MISYKQMKLFPRDAARGDAGTLISLIKDNLAVDQRFSSYYSSPSVKNWNRSRGSGGGKFLQSHVVVEMERNGEKHLTVGYARYVGWHADGIPCGFIRGPWINTTLDSRSRVEVGRFIVDKLCKKMTGAGFSLARVQVPLFYGERLALFKDELGFSTVDTIFTYSNNLARTPPVPAALPADFHFSRYSGSPDEEGEIIRLNNEVFPRERLTAESFTSLKDKHGGFTGQAAIYLLRKSDMLLGMAWVDYRPAPGSDNHSCWVHDLAVAPSFQRQGLGKALVLHCIKGVISGTTRVSASISGANTASTRTFESCDFTLEENSGMVLLEKELQAE